VSSCCCDPAVEATTPNMNPVGVIADCGGVCADDGCVVVLARSIGVGARSIFKRETNRNE
jgi:hypothetical protein